jgi:hypothetical protein
MKIKVENFELNISLHKKKKKKSYVYFFVCMAT